MYKAFSFNKLLQLIVIGWSFSVFAEYEWIDEQINNDFASYEAGISREQLDLTMQVGRKTNQKLKMRKIHLLRIKFINGVLYIFDDEGKKVDQPAISYHFQKIMKKEDLPDLDFIYCNGPGTDQVDVHGMPFPGPVLSGNKRDSSTNVILFHDRMTAVFNNDYSWEKAHKNVDQAVKITPWEKKYEKMVWYGRITDKEIDNFKEKLSVGNSKLSVDNSKRVKLYFLAEQYPRLMEVGLTKLWLNREGAELGIRLSPRKNIEYHMKYKYQIVLDGHTCTNPSYAWRLLSNCACLKVDSPLKQWFYAGLIEGVHYLPIESDLSNLVDTIETLKVNDTLARSIAEAGREWAKRNLVDETLLIEYCAKVLKKYASLQNFEPALTRKERREYFPK